MDEITLTKNEYRKQRWTELIHERQESGMTVQNFCDMKSINVKTYYYWLRKLRTEIKQQAIVAMPVSVDTDETCKGAITIKTDKITIEMTEAASADIIVAVITALKSPC